jgi:Alpha/beta hydrolase domain
MFHTENIKIGGGITLITKMSYIPTTNSTRLFASAAEKCDFTEIDYIEDEYFMSGTANIYEESEDQKPKVIISDAPYTTRLLIRRPKEKQKFSGNIVIEILNATAMIDIDRMWVNSWQFFTRNGDIYIGITSKGHVVDSLKKYNILCGMKPSTGAILNRIASHPKKS